MNSMVPAQVPSYWQVYFTVEDVDKSHKKAVALGAHETLAPQDFPGGRFSTLSAPQGASIGLLKMKEQREANCSRAGTSPACTLSEGRESRSPRTCRTRSHWQLGRGL